MTHEGIVYDRHVRLIEHAATINNITGACRVFGVSRKTYTLIERWSDGYTERQKQVREHLGQIPSPHRIGADVHRPEYQGPRHPAHLRRQRQTRNCSLPQTLHRSRSLPNPPPPQICSVVRGPRFRARNEAHRSDRSRSTLLRLGHRDLSHRKRRLARPRPRPTTTSPTTTGNGSPNFPESALGTYRSITPRLTRLRH